MAKVLILAVAILAAAILFAALLRDSGGQIATELDFEFYKKRVEPIFLKKRSALVRCYVCHGEASNNAFRLEKLAPGAKSWTEEQSRRNFEMVSKLVTLRDTGKSKLLTHPLAPEAGGEPYHSGGRQFGAKDEPDFRTISRWVNGAKIALRWW
jgi:hypothetical protein